MNEWGPFGWGWGGAWLYREERRMRRKLRCRRKMENRRCNRRKKR